jgi:hypothetical protein
MNLFNRHTVWLAALLLGGCASLSPRPPLEIPNDRAASCPEWKWVALKPSATGTCPLPAFGTWHIRRGFPPGGSQPAASYGKREASNLVAQRAKQYALRRICLYESPSKGKLGRAIRDLYQDRELEQIYPDCAMMGSLAEPSLAEQTWQDLQSHLFSQVGRSDLTRGVADVRLTILDTQPKALWESGESGNSPHGWFVAHLGRRLVCDDDMEDPASDSCAAKVTTRLALPLKSFHRKKPGKTMRDKERGGYFGTVSDLTEAIGQEMAEAEGSEEQEHLVLNLSLGWVGTREELEEDVDDMPVPVQFLYHVLEEAACKGVLVIAAAGNRIGGPTPETGMLLPAAWAERTVACEDGSRPLVYAVGGVDSAGRPLCNARENGMPELAAFADHAVVETFDPGQPTKTYTGSSVAAAVASAAAAVVWSEQPTWTGRGVMETLYNSGSELALGADVVTAPSLGSATSTRIAALSPFAFAVAPHLCTNPPCVHRICLGQALCEASGGARCSQRCAWSQPWHLGLDFNPTRTIDVSGYTYRWNSKVGCTADHVRYLPTVEPPSYLCPSDQFDSVLAHPWVGPQPQDPPCPNCTLEPPGTGGGSGLLAAAVGDSYTLYIEIDSDWSEPLYDSTLRLGETLVPLSLGVLNRGDRATVEGIDSTWVNGADPVVLEFTVKEGSEEKSVENPVLVVQ